MNTDNMKKTKQKVTFYSVLVNGVVIKDFKSHAPASAYKNKKLKEHPDWSVEIQEKAR